LELGIWSFDRSLALAAAVAGCNFARFAPT
jgi:hypothetical protein